MTDALARIRAAIAELDRAQQDDHFSGGGWYAVTGNGYIEAHVTEDDLRALVEEVERLRTGEVS